MYTGIAKLFFDNYDPMEWETVRRYVESCLWYLVTLLLALFLPNIGAAINFAGSVTVFFYFVFPGLFLAKIGWSRQEELGQNRMVVMMILGLFLFAFGLVLFVQGLWLAFQNMFETGDKEQTICERLASTTTGNATLFS